jgi:GT2 family glycosyltransferase
MSQFNAALLTVTEPQVWTERRRAPRPTTPDRSTAVVIATRGRPEVVRALIARLSAQTRPPEHVFVIGAQHEDVAGLALTGSGLTARVGRTGSALQRNDALQLAAARFAYIVFFDDDFVPSRFWLERVVRLFEARPDIDGFTGRVLADGAVGPGIGLGPALAEVAAEDASPAPLGGPLHDNVGYGHNTGCNMAFRYSAISALRFDERLPAYAWLEDADFRAQVTRHGRFARAEALWGVHLGHKAGRSRGVPLGYSQIANAVYLAEKGTVPVRYLAQTAARNVASNLLRALRPEHFIDRRGRLKGNLIALGDWIKGRLAPERILEL